MSQINIMQAIVQAKLMFVTILLNGQLWLNKLKAQFKKKLTGCVLGLQQQKTFAVIR